MNRKLKNLNKHVAEASMEFEGNGDFAIIFLSAQKDAKKIGFNHGAVVVGDSQGIYNAVRQLCSEDKKLNRIIGDAAMDAMLHHNGLPDQQGLIDTIAKQLKK